MEITDVRLKLILDASDRLKAVCTITFDGEFVVRDVKIVEGTSGLFVAMPSRKLTLACPRCRHKNHLRAKHCNECGSKLPAQDLPPDADGRTRLHRDIAHPITPAFRETLQQRVIEAYEAERKITAESCDELETEEIPVEESVVALADQEDDTEAARDERAARAERTERTDETEGARDDHDEHTDEPEGRDDADDDDEADEADEDRAGCVTEPDEYSALIADLKGGPASHRREPAARPRAGVGAGAPRPGGDSEGAEPPRRRRRRGRGRGRDGESREPSPAKRDRVDDAPAATRDVAATAPADAPVAAEPVVARPVAPKPVAPRPVATRPAAPKPVVERVVPEPKREPAPADAVSLDKEMEKAGTPDDSGADSDAFGAGLF